MTAPEPPDAPSSSPSGETSVGIRELRHDFRAWLERVRQGERIVITDRGMPIADLIAHDPNRTWLDMMYEQGYVQVARGSVRIGWKPDDPITSDASAALREQREERLP